MGKTFFVADFYHWIGGGILHDCFKVVCDATYEKSRIFICEATAWGYVSVGVDVENVTRALTVIFFEPAAGLPGARVV